MPSSRAQSSPSPLALLCTLASAFALFAWLKVKPVDPQTKEVNSNENTGHTQHKTAPVLASKLEIPQAVSHQEEATTKRHKVPDWLKFGVNCLTLAALVWYACEARNQGVAMDNTFNQVQQQTDLMRKQVIGTQAAVLEIADTPVWDGKEKISLPINNLGVSNATILNSPAHIVRMSFPERTPIGDAIPLPIPHKVLRGGHQGGINPSWQLPWPLPSGTFDDSHPWPGNEVVVIEGSITFNDGFEDRTQSFCSFYLPRWNIPSISGWSVGGFRGGEVCDIPSYIKDIREIETFAKEELKTGKRHQY